MSLYGGTITIGYADAPFSLTRDITLDGDLDDDGSPDMTISGNNYSQVIYTSGLTTAAVIEGLNFINGSSFDGGGMYNDESSPVLTNCTFTGNSASYCGGGMYNFASSPALTGCTFTGNSAFSGGGMFNNGSSPALTDCTFTGNSATTFAGMGGGMCNNYSSPVLTNCTFYGNSAMMGGGMHTTDSWPAVINCVFYGNSASYGGGMSNFSSYTTVTNCTFYGNSASYGGGIYNQDELPIVTNCILWGDSAGEITADCTVNYSDIQGGHAGTGNKNEDPLFVDPSNGDFHLQYGSPCIDTGTNTAPYIPSCDFEDDARIIDGNLDSTARADMGVDEFLPPQADLEITKIDSPDPVIAGQDLTYTITITNNGPADAGDITLTDDLPLQVEDAQYSTDGGNNWADWSSPFSLGALDSGSDVEIMIRGTVDSATAKDTLITNTASISYSREDPDPDNNSSTAETRVDTSADLEITKTDDHDPAVAGGLLTYTITVTNHGPSDATGVEVTDNLPDGVTYRSAASASGNVSQSAGTVTWDGFDLASDAVTDLIIVVSVHSPILAPETISNQVTVACGQDDPDTVNNTASQDTALGSAPNVGGELEPLDKGNVLAPLAGLTLLAVLAAFALITLAGRRKAG